MIELKGRWLLVLGATGLIYDAVNIAKELGVYTIVTDYYPNAPAKKIADKSYDVSTVDIDALAKLFNLALTGITNFTSIPLWASAVLGIGVAAAGFLYGLILVIQKLLNPSVVLGFTSLMVVMLLLGGVIFIALGLIGEYIGSFDMISSNMPQYTIREITNKEKKSKKKEGLLVGSRK